MLSIRSTRDQQEIFQLCNTRVVLSKSPNWAIGVFPKWRSTVIEFNEFTDLINHWSMNLGHYKDNLCYIWHCGIITVSRTRGSRIKYILQKQLWNTEWCYPKVRTRLLVFFEFSEFTESDKSLKHELGSLWRSSLLHMSSWHRGIITVSCTRGSRIKYIWQKHSTYSEDSVELNLVKKLD